MRFSGWKVTNLPEISLGRRHSPFFGPSSTRLPSAIQGHQMAGVEGIYHSNFWNLQQQYSHSRSPHSKGDDDPVQFPAGIRLHRQARPRPSPSLACRVALMDLTAEKHYTPVLNKFSSRPTPDEVVEGQYAPLQMRHTIVHLFCPLQKCTIYGLADSRSGKCCEVPGSIPAHFWTTFAPLNSFSPHSCCNCPHQCTIGVQQSGRRRGRPIGSLPGAF